MRAKTATTRNRIWGAAAVRDRTLSDSNAGLVDPKLSAAVAPAQTREKPAVWRAGNIRASGQRLPRQ
jgi:hypothetical protein